MPKINVYLPDDLAEKVKALDLPVSSICQRALEEAAGLMSETRDRRATRTMERFTDAARAAISAAREEAIALRHSYIGTEHLLLALLRAPEGKIAHLLEEAGVTPADVRQVLDSMMGPPEEEIPESVPFTPRAKTVLELTLREALAMGHNYVDREHLMLALIREGGGLASQGLDKLGIDLGAARRTIVGPGGTDLSTAQYLSTVGWKRARSVARAASDAGIMSLLEMRLKELREEMSEQFELLKQEREAERNRNDKLWDLLREHGIDPGESDLS